MAGPNGAGKTTFAREFLPNYADCKNFVNADLIAAGVSPFAPETAAFRAAKLMLKEIELFAKQGVDFGFETTLFGRSYLKTIRWLKERRYKIHIFFVSVPNVELALARIRKRVLKGGHNVPEADVRRRFDRSLRNFLVDYRPLADSWILFDNSRKPSIVALARRDALRIIKSDIYKALVARYEEND